MTDTEEMIPVETDEEVREKALTTTKQESREGAKAFWRQYRRTLLGALLGVGAACLFMWLGFWKTVFILGMAGLGAFLFGVDHKMDALKNCINRLFPSRK